MTFESNLLLSCFVIIFMFDVIKYLTVPSEGVNYFDFKIYLENATKMGGD